MTFQNSLHHETSGHRYCCSVVPPYVLQDIASSDRVSQAVRDIAAKSLAQIADIHRARASALASTSAAVTDLSAAVSVPNRLHRVIYDGGQQCGGPGIKTFEDGDGTLLPNHPDSSVRNVGGHFEKVYNFYRDKFERNSYDNRGKALHISVHFDCDPEPGYANALWIPGRPISFLAFGDGDPSLFHNFTEPLDIAAHEYAHAVTEYTGKLPYLFQAGALNESISDVFGSMVKQFFAVSGGQNADEADWLVGKGMWKQPGGVALRNMENPGTAFNIEGVTKDIQPASMDDYMDLPYSEDAGGVHINSGIPNRAFVLVAKALGGYSWDVAGKIWYASLKDPALRNLFRKDGRPIIFINENDELIVNERNLDPVKDTFNIFAKLTVKHAQSHSRAAVQAVESAWKTVGVLP